MASQLHPTLAGTPYAIPVVCDRFFSGALGILGGMIDLGAAECGGLTTDHMPDPSGAGVMLGRLPEGVLGGAVLGE